MKTQTQYIKADIMCMSTEELDEIQFAIQMRRAAIGLNNRHAFNIGDVVEFGSAKRGYKVGTIDKIKIKKAIVVEDNGPKWKARYWSCFQWRAGAKVDN